IGDQDRRPGSVVRVTRAEDELSTGDGTVVASAEFASRPVITRYMFSSGCVTSHRAPCACWRTPRNSDIAGWMRDGDGAQYDTDSRSVIGWLLINTSKVRRSSGSHSPMPGAVAPPRRSRASPGYISARE